MPMCLILLSNYFNKFVMDMYGNQSGGFVWILGLKGLRQSSPTCRLLYDTCLSWFRWMWQCGAFHFFFPKPFLWMSRFLPPHILVRTLRENISYPPHFFVVPFENRFILVVCRWYSSTGGDQNKNGTSLYYLCILQKKQEHLHLINQNCVQN